MRSNLDYMCTKKKLIMEENTYKKLLGNIVYAWLYCCGVNV